MISLEDCVALSGLTEEQVLAIAEHEHLPEIAATALIKRAIGTGAARGERGRPPRLVILCVDVLGFLIGLEPNLELAHQRQQAGHAGDRFEQRP